MKEIEENFIVDGRASKQRPFEDHVPLFLVLMFEALEVIAS